MRPMRALMCFAALPLLLACGAASAQILIGQTAGFSGPVAAGVKEVTDGAKLYFDAVNAKGGINGQAIELLSMDDKFEPKLAAENARELITRKNVLALFLTRGTPHTQAVMPLLTEYKVPLVAPSTGAMALHTPVNPWLFNVRATYQREADRAVRHLSLVGVTRIAVVQVDDTFGADAIQGAMNAFAAVDKQPLFVDKYDRTKPDYSKIAPHVASSNAQAVLFIGSGAAVADGIDAIRGAGSKAQIVTLSNNASAGFIKQLKDNARGTIVTQVFPYERSLAAPIVKEARELAKARGAAEITPAMIEGFAGAKVLVEALRRAGPSPSRDRLRAALETFKRVDIGGLEVSFGPGSHSGLDYADLSIIGPDGKFQR